MARMTKDVRQAAAQAATEGVSHGLRILELYIENVKRVKIARIKPKGNVVVVAGKNGSGKSSVLDAIDWALTGVSNVPTFPIRKGQRTATVKVNIGEFRVERHFTIVDHEKSEKGNTYLSKLVITGKKGEQYPSPQILLNQLLGSISFDPLAFLRMKQDDQVETLRSLVQFDIDIDALDAEQKADYDERRVAGRGVDNARAQLAALNEPPADLPAEEIDTAAIVAKMRRANDHNADVARMQRQKEGIEQDRAKAIENAKKLRDAAMEQLSLADAIDGGVSHVEVTPHSGAKGQPKGAVQIFDEHLARIVIFEPMDTAALGVELEEANRINGSIRAAAKHRQTEELLRQSEELWEQIDTRMKNRDAQRAAAIARAKMPIEGLGVGFDQVLYKDLPLAQASNAEQIRVSMALGMATNPKLRVLRISDGSLLDDDSLQLIAQAADEHDFQVWIERVETGGKVSVIMEDGEASGEDVVPGEEKKA